MDEAQVAARAALQTRIDATKKAGTCELSPGEYVGPVEVRRPIVLDGGGATLWAREGPALVVLASGVTLRNLRIEVVGGVAEGEQGERQCALLLATKSRPSNITIENVEVRGAVAGLPGEEGDWKYPATIQLGDLKARSESVHSLQLYVPVACTLESDIEGVHLGEDVLHLAAGAHDVVIRVGEMSAHTLVHGNFFLKTPLLRRRIVVIGRVIGTAPERRSEEALQTPEDLFAGEKVPPPEPTGLGEPRLSPTVRAVYRRALVVCSLWAQLGAGALRAISELSRFIQARRARRAPPRSARSVDRFIAYAVLLAIAVVGVEIKWDVFAKRAAPHARATGAERAAPIVVAVLPSERADSIIATVNKERDDLRLACGAADYHACASLGDYLLDGRGTAPDTLGARTLYQTACDNLDLYGCAGLAATLVSGPDSVRMVALFRQACNGGEMRGCSGLGQLYELGLGVPTNDALAGELITQACDGDDSRGCYSLGAEYALRKDEARAAVYYEKSCEEGLALGCLTAATFILESRGVDASDGRVTELFRKACHDGIAEGCYQLGLMYHFGRSVIKNEALAASMYQVACGSGEMFACNNLGSLYLDGRGVAKNERRAAAQYQEACDGGNMTGCSNLGIMNESGRSVPVNLARALELYRQACDGGEKAGCENLNRKRNTPRGDNR